MQIWSIPLKNKNDYKKLAMEPLAQEFSIAKRRDTENVTRNNTPLMRKEVMIRSIDDLLNIKQQNPLLRRPRRTCFLLQLPYLSEEECYHYQKKLSQYYSSCGCESGAALGLISLLAFIIIIGVNNTIQWNWVLILYGMGVFALGVFTGKATGLTIATMRKQRLVKKIIKLKNHQ